jgi:chromosome segregation ATPase
MFVFLLFFILFGLVAIPLIYLDAELSNLHLIKRLHPKMSWNSDAAIHVEGWDILTHFSLSVGLILIVGLLLSMIILTFFGYRSSIKTLVHNEAKSSVEEAKKNVKELQIKLKKTQEEEQKKAYQSYQTRLNKLVEKESMMKSYIDNETAKIQSWYSDDVERLEYENAKVQNKLNNEQNELNRYRDELDNLAFNLNREAHKLESLKKEFNQKKHKQQQLNSGALGQKSRALNKLTVIREYIDTQELKLGDEILTYETLLNKSKAYQRKHHSGM